MAIQTARAFFTGAEDSVAVTWPTLGTATPAVSMGVTTLDAPLGVISASYTTLTASGCTVVPTERFTGTVEVIAMDV